MLVDAGLKSLGSADAAGGCAPQTWPHRTGIITHATRLCLIMLLPSTLAVLVPG